MQPVPAVAVDMNDTRFDLPDFEGRGTDYVMCSLPRFGSTLLAYLLRDCGAMGVPHEYLHPTVHLPVLARRFQSIRQDGVVDMDIYTPLAPEAALDSQWGLRIESSFQSIGAPPEY
jgi:LPS sulfotransferase NodH